MEKVKQFLINYRGAIIAGILLGNYVQHNKELVKEKLKSYIDKL